MLENKLRDLHKVIDQLLPNSKRWLIQQGYLISSDDELVITPTGYAYFARIMESHHANTKPGAGSEASGTGGKG